MRTIFLLTALLLAACARPSSDPPDVDLPATLPPLARTLSAGERNVLAIDARGRIFGWGDNQHVRNGNVMLADGSVQSYSRGSLQTALANTGDTGHSTAQGTWVNASGNTAGTGVNRMQFP